MGRHDGHVTILFINFLPLPKDASHDISLIKWSLRRPLKLHCSKYSKEQSTFLPVYNNVNYPNFGPIIDGGNSNITRISASFGKLFLVPQIHNDNINFDTVNIGLKVQHEMWAKVEDLHCQTHKKGTVFLFFFILSSAS